MCVLDNATLLACQVALMTLAVYGMFGMACTMKGIYYTYRSAFNPWIESNEQAAYTATAIQTTLPITFSVIYFIMYQRAYGTTRLAPTRQ
jgi:hypothetical protein